MRRRLIIFPTIAENVDSQIDGMAHWHLVGNTFASNAKTSRSVRCGSHERKPSKIVHSAFYRQCAERCDSLIVIHCQYGIELLPVASTKELVGCIRSKCLNALLFKGFDCRIDNLLFLGPQQSVGPRLGIERENSDAWVGYPEITAYTIMQHGCTINDGA